MAVAYPLYFCGIHCNFFLFDCNFIDLSPLCFFLGESNILSVLCIFSNIVSFISPLICMTPFLLLTVDFVCSLYYCCRCKFRLFQIFLFLEVRLYCYKLPPLRNASVMSHRFWIKLVFIVICVYILFPLISSVTLGCLVTY